MRFLIDAMLPPGVAEDLLANGHEAVTPEGLGAQDLSDEQLVDIATAEGRVIVTANASDFAQVSTCSVLFVRKTWWPAAALRSRVSAALDRWAADHPEPGNWPCWLPAELR